MGDGALGFIALIGVIATILNIILFFKVWGMTNDVMKLTKIAQKFTNIEHLLEQDVLVKHDEYRKLANEKDRILSDPKTDFTERLKLGKEINKKMKDTIFK